MSAELFERRFPESPEARAELLVRLAKTGMDAIVERSLRDPGYPWIDTKFSLIDGRDFDEGDPIRGRDTVYAWIQGRGLEAMAGHLRFFEARRLADGPSAARYRRALRTTAESVAAAREKGRGHLFFSLTRDGCAKAMKGGASWAAKELSPESAYNLSDIFCSRGLYAAAAALRDTGLAASARDYCLRTYRAVLEGRYESDQQQFDPKNPVLPIPGRISHAPFMLQIPTLTMLFRDGVVDAREGIDLVAGIVSRHVNGSGRFPGLAEGDFLEFIDAEGGPFQGKAVSDPGHALEFTGLAARFLSAAEARLGARNGTVSEIEAARSVLLGVFRRGFEAGFDRVHGGIVKLVDLSSGKILNADMPWWSLPETMRAALECMAFARGAEERAFLEDAFRSCGQALLEHYVSVKAHLLCVQTRGADGEIVGVIPAVPDADPGYHTGLSLIRCVELLEGAREELG